MQETSIGSFLSTLYTWWVFFTTWWQLFLFGIAAGCFWFWRRNPWINEVFTRQPVYVPWADAQGDLAGIEAALLEVGRHESSLTWDQRESLSAMREQVARYHENAYAIARTELRTLLSRARKLQKQLGRRRMSTTTD